MHIYMLMRSVFTLQWVTCPLGPVVIALSRVRWVNGEWPWHRWTWQPVSGRFGISVTELLCRRLLRGSGRHARSRWGDDPGMVPRRVSAMSRAERRLIRTWRTRLKLTRLRRSPLGDILPVFFSVLVAETRLEGRMTPAPLMVSCH